MRSSKEKKGGDKAMWQGGYGEWGRGDRKEAIVFVIVKLNFDFLNVKNKKYTIMLYLFFSIHRYKF